jgi:outer membrane receptor for ferrienterochelin and colicin
MTRSTRVQLSRLSLALVAAMAMAPAFAQSTSSGLTGVVTSADGQPVAGADVTITHVESGTVRHATTDANGRYAAQGLRVGGPYTVTVNSASGTDTESNVYLELNKVATIDAKVGAAANTLDTVTVTASRAAAMFTADNKGVGTNISGRALETAVSGNRSLDDIARLDPRVTVTDSSDGSISVAGQNNRYNNISVDGLSVNDPFGLNSNGMGFVGSPVSPDTIAAYDIKISDYDAGTDSVGANINAVTKSGTNDFHGSVYYAFTNADSMVGNLGGEDYSLFDKNKTMGVTLGGPIVKDRLFFFAAYEDQKTTGLGAGSGTDAVTSGMLTQAQVDAVASAFEGLGITTGANGGGASAVSLEDKRTLVKLDWNINDRQRASFTYQRTEESKPGPYNGYVKTNSVVLPSNWYTSSNKTDNYSLQLFSDWTDNFSTELKVGYQKYDNTNAASSEQPEVVACFDSATCSFAFPPSFGPAARSIASTTPWVVAGEDWYRHENAISSKRWTATLSGTWYAGDHTVKGGVDFMSNESFDIFGQGLHGSYLFADKNGDGSPVDEIMAGDYYSFIKNYLPAGVDLAASGGQWKYSQTSPFIQDTWQVTDNLSITYGVRVDIPKSDHAPPVAVEGTDAAATPLSPGVAAGDPVWEGRFGYPSNTTLGWKNKVIEPRFAFNYAFNTARLMQLRGGVGLFQSTPPTVWLSNPYINNGVFSSRTYSSTDPNADPFSNDPYNQPGPTGAVGGVCGGTGGNCGNIDVLDPDFKLPTSWKLSLGYDAELPWWGLVGSVEYLHLQAKDAIAYQQPNVGVPNPDAPLPDGRESYWTGFNPDPTKIGLGATNGRNPEFGAGSTLLTNTDKGHTDSVTFSLTKPFSQGLSGSFSTTFSHSTDVTPGTSSQAASNYNYVARVNPNGFNEATARFDIPLSVKATLNWEHAFWGDNKTTVSVYYNGHDGQPYSWTFGNDVNGDTYGFNDLAYIPLANDPKVAYVCGATDCSAQIAAFQDFIDNNSYLSDHRGQIAGRNGARQPWVNQLDLGVQQEFPGFFQGNKFVVRLDVYNFLNLLNKDWGTQEGVGYFATRTLTTVADVNADGQYVYDLSKAPQSYTTYDNIGTPPSRVTSRWSAVVTLRYKF